MRRSHQLAFRFAPAVVAGGCIDFTLVEPDDEPIDTDVIDTEPDICRSDEIRLEDGMPLALGSAPADPDDDIVAYGFLEFTPAIVDGQPRVWATTAWSDEPMGGLHLLSIEDWQPVLDHSHDPLVVSGRDWAQLSIASQAVTARSDAPGMGLWLSAEESWANPTEAIFLFDAPPVARTPITDAVARIEGLSGTGLPTPDLDGDGLDDVFYGGRWTYHLAPFDGTRTLDDADGELVVATDGPMQVNGYETFDDLDGDGHTDLATVYLDDRAYNAPHGNALYLVYGPLLERGELSDGDFVVVAGADSPEFGFVRAAWPRDVVAVGDVTGDGVRDLAVGYLEGTKIIDHFEPGVWTTADFPVSVAHSTVEIDGQTFQAAPWPAGDLDGNASEDLLFEDGIVMPRGHHRSYVVTSPVASGERLPDDSTVAEFVFASGDDVAYTHRSRPIGDLDGDGRADWVVYTHSWLHGHPGTAWLFRGCSAW